MGLLNFPQRPGPQLASCLGDWELVTKGVLSSGGSAFMDPGDHPAEG